jgi:hypothetical protein
MTNEKMNQGEKGNQHYKQANLKNAEADLAIRSVRRILVPDFAGNRSTKVIFQLVAHSPSLGRPKEGPRKVAAGAGPALSLRKAYSVEARKSVEFLTPVVTSTNPAGLGADESTQRSWFCRLKHSTYSKLISA